MESDDFEWSDDKAAENEAKHGVSFEAAAAALDDPLLLSDIEDSIDYDEERYWAIGMVDGRCLYVVFTYRNGRRRIIHARIAEPKLRKLYHGE